MLAATVLFAGCTTSVSSDGTGVVNLYRVGYEGSDVFVEGTSHGWMATVTNEYDDPIVVGLDFVGKVNGRIVRPIQEDMVGYEAFSSNVDVPGVDPAFTMTLDAGESTLVLAHVESYGEFGTNFTVGWELTAYNEQATRTLVQFPTTWTVERTSAGTAVSAGDHVQTVTVGMWINGTSFYTNAGAALDDPAFPGGEGWVNATEDGRDPLPIYVYGEDRSEQPYGSKDTCHFTTITGYNDLLKTQSEGSTGVRMLQPEDGYTYPGREDFGLYGHVLVFMNTVVAHDGATGPQDEFPNNEGACYQQERACHEVPSELPEAIRDPLVEGCAERLGS